MNKTSWTGLMCNPVQILVKTKVVYLKTTEVTINPLCLKKLAALIQIVNYGKWKCSHNSVTLSFLGMNGMSWVA